jgi:hypothetical protein
MYEHLNFEITCYLYDALNYVQDTFSKRERGGYVQSGARLALEY